MTPVVPQARQRRFPGPVLYLVLVPLWAWLLHGFVSVPVLITLTLVGPLSLLLGTCLAAGSLRHVMTSPWYGAAFLLGGLMVFGGVLTLAPQAPAGWLNTSATGWQLLDQRMKGVSRALQEEDWPRARRLLSRGLGEDEPFMANGRPLLHAAADTMLQDLLAAGLNPDVRDEEGRSLLALTWETDIAQGLLDAGADVEARDRLGATPLMAARDKSEAFILLLLEAGADVHAVDDAGRRVVDLFDAAGPRRQLLETFAGGRPLPAAGQFDALSLGRRDWIDLAPDAGEPGLSLDGAAHAGELVQARIKLINDSAQDRLLDVRLELGLEALLITASHGGEIANPQLTPVTQTLRWPLLALPAGRSGTLNVTLLLREAASNERYTGDLSLYLQARDRLSQIDEQFTLEQALAEPPVRASGSIRYLVGLALLFLAVLVLGMRLLRGRIRRGSLLRPAAGFGALLCIGLAALQGWQLAQPFIAFDVAQCTVLDRRARPYSVEPQRRTGTEQRLISPRGRTRLEYAPLAAVRIDTGADTVFAAGFATGAALRPLQALQAFPPGSTHTCWIDPVQPSRFTLQRTPATTTVVSMILLLSLASLLAAVAGFRRRTGGIDR